MSRPSPTQPSPAADASLSSHERTAPRAGGGGIAGAFTGPPRLHVLGIAVATLGSMLVAAVALRAFHSLFPLLGEEAIVARMAIVLVLAAIVPALLSAIRRRSAAHVEHLAILLLAGITVVLGSVYFYSISFAVQFPADILLWSEGDFVADITKLIIGYPLYTAPANLESFTYAPGAQLLTYGLMRLLGLGVSVPAFRVVQVGFMAASALVAMLSLRIVLRQTGHRQRMQQAWPWYVIAAAALILIAGNAITNPFTFYLHNDALALLISSIAFWLLLEYMATRQPGWLFFMAAVPGLGFLAKQSLIVWAGLYIGYLAVFDRPIRWKRLTLFGIASAGGVGLAVGACYALWGGDFLYWAFEVMGNHAVSPLRSALHMLDAWEYFALGLIGGIVLMRELGAWALGAWMLAMALLILEAYTSGIAWMLNHMGPGSLLVAIFGVTALIRAWPEADETRRQAWLPAMARASLTVVIVALASNGLGLFRLPVPAIPQDAYRYVHDIEAEFEGIPTDRVLLDFGSWLYAPRGLVMKDRAAASGEAGWTQTADFSGFLARIQQRQYAKILVREYHDSTFTYDHADWVASSGVRQALGAHYREVRQIPAVTGRGGNRVWFRTISVLIPAESH